MKTQDLKIINTEYPRWVSYNYILSQYKQYPEDFPECPIDFIQEKVLGFCSCGLPEKNLDLVRKVLRNIQTRWETDTCYEYVTSEEADTFIMYVLDSRDILEHGCGIGGSWLSVFGKDLLEDLTKMKEEGLLDD